MGYIEYDHVKYTWYQQIKMYIPLRNTNMLFETVSKFMIYLQVQRTRYFLASWSFQMFIYPLFQMKLYLLSTVLLRRSQSPMAALKSIEWGST